MHRKVLSLLLVFCLLLGMIPFGGSALAAGSDTSISYTAHDQETLLSALSQIEESGDAVSKHEILITNGFSLNKTIVFPKDRNIILRGEAEPLHIISADGELLKTGGSMFVIPDYDSPTDKRVQIYGLELDACAPADKTVNVRIIWAGANADLLLGRSGIKTILRRAYVSGASNGGAAVYAGM